MWWDRVITGVLVIAAAVWMFRLGWRTVRSWQRGGACNNCASRGCNTQTAPPPQKIIQISLDNALHSRISIDPDNTAGAPREVVGRHR
jgi:hypothetical protein